jgi:hypothetical protein
MPPGAVGGPGGDGGGIYNAGAAAIAHSSIQDNQAGQGQDAGSHGTAGQGGAGGGIYNAGELLLRQSTVNGNAAGDGGMGLACGRGGDGGGITSTGSGSLWMGNSTVSGNRTGAGGVSFMSGPCASGNGGGIYTNGGVTLNNSTLTANRTGGAPGGDGGGILVADRSVVMRSSILAGNTATGAGPDCRTFGALPSVIELRGANLVQQTAGCTFVEAPYGPSIVGLDPLLLPLGKYGGPTLTHALGIGSPALDAGSCTDTRGDPVTEDQRGVVRPQGKGCDIGAFEGVRAGVYLPLVLK